MRKCLPAPIETSVIVEHRKESNVALEHEIRALPAAPLRADPLRVIDRSAAGSACSRPRHRPSDRHDAARV
ncbi:hypothetical protein ACWD1Y_30290 [Streptomyces sp. NPDC002814]